MTVLIVLCVINLIGLVIDSAIRINQIKKTNAVQREIEEVRLRGNANMALLQDIEKLMKICGCKKPKNQLEFILTVKHD